MTDQPTCKRCGEPKIARTYGGIGDGHAGGGDLVVVCSNSSCPGDADMTENTEETDQ